MGERIRNFDPDVETIAKKWRAEVVSEGDWTVVGDPSPTESGAFFVRSPEAEGFAKPWANTTSVASKPRAAFEKIAGDMAYDLGLPVPPVILWKRPRSTPTSEECVAISARPFRGVTWRLAGTGQQAKEWLRLLRPAASAMIPFDTWVMNPDRTNSGNLLVGGVGSGESGVRSAYLDFANAFYWPDDAWQRSALASIFPTESLEEKSVIMDTLERIEGYPDGTIERIVDRIPLEFLPADHRNRIMEGLIARKNFLRETIARLTRKLR